MMIPFEQALQIVLNTARVLDREHVGLSDSLGRVLAEDVTSDIDMPPFPKATVDGYACRRTDLRNEMRVVETIQAGTQPTQTIGPNQCAKIMTGAAVPSGADCVVMIEQTVNVGDKAVRFTGEQSPDHICRQAEDIVAGQAVLGKGSLIGPPHVAVMASVGCVRPLVARRPRVGIVAGGDELVEPGVRPGPFQIRNSNTAQLEGQLHSVGAVTQDYGAAGDVAEEIDGVLKTALAESDVVLISGGVSMGDFDLVPSVLRQNGVELLFEKIAVKPGKPTVFGVSDRAYCFGLPGNPVSTFVTFDLLVKPFLYRLMGHDYWPKCVKMRLGRSICRKDAGRQSWIPVKITAPDTVEPVEYHGSAHILALCQTNGFVPLEIGVTNVPENASVIVRLL